MEPPRIPAYIPYVSIESVIIICPHFAADAVDLPSFNFFWSAPQNLSTSARVTFQPFTVIQGH